MSELVRFGVAMDRSLLDAFDARIAAKGYENRSEALRDLVRADLNRAAWESNARVTATLTVVVAKKSRPEVARHLDAAPGFVVSTMQVNVDETKLLEVSVLRGPAGEVAALAGRIAGTRGVLTAELTVGCVEERERRS